MRGESPSSLEHPSWPQAEKQPPCPFSTPSGRGKAAARDDSCADLSARCRGLGECGLPGAARGGCSDIGCRRASPLHTSVAGAQQHDPVARLPGARTDSVRHSGAVRRHTFSRRPSSSVGPRATPPTPSHSAPRAALSTRCRPVGATPRAARQRHEYPKRHRLARSLHEATRPWDGGR
jgi:hypothetical protein